MAINWQPLNRFATAFHEIGMSKEARDRQKSLDYLKKLKTMAELSKVYSEDELQDVAIGMGDGGPPIPVPKLRRQLTELEKAYNKEVGQRLAERHYPDPEPQGESLKPTDALKNYIYMSGDHPNIEGFRGRFLKWLREKAEASSVVTNVEKDIISRKAWLPKLTKWMESDEGKNKVFRRGWRIYPDGSLALDESGAPVKLPDFATKMGKRGNIKEIRLIGRLRDDAFELTELFNDPEVQKALGVLERDQTVWQDLKNLTKNRIRAWLARKGLKTTNRKTLEFLQRLGMYASEKRHEILGAAVTATEFESVRIWLPDPGDSFDVLREKLGIVGHEANEAFFHFVKPFEQIADMSPFYHAFGVQKFPTTVGEKPPQIKVMPQKRPKTSGYVKGRVYTGKDADGSTVRARYGGKDEKGVDIWVKE